MSRCACGLYTVMLVPVVSARIYQVISFFFTCFSVGDQELKSELERLVASIEDISEDKLDKIMRTAESKMAESAAAMAAADEEHQAAKCELTGAQSGDGRDETNRSLPERLRETESAIVRSLVHMEVMKVPLGFQHSASSCSRKILCRNSRRRMQNVQNSQ